jgi:hypothetical protein
MEERLSPLNPGFEVLQRFTFHPATPQTGPRHDAVRAESRQFAAWILENIPDCRERSLALTALQESMMWLNAAVAYRE